MLEVNSCHRRFFSRRRQRMFEIKRTVGCSNVGVDGKLTLGSAIDFMQDCSMFQLNSLKTLMKYFDYHNLGMYLVSRQIGIVRMPVYGENLIIRTWIYECNRVYGYRNTIVYNEDGCPCITTYAIGAFIDLSTNRPFCMPDDMIQGVLMCEKFPMEYLPRKIAIPKNEAMVANPTTVLKYHLDYNNHVNNSKYVSIAEEYLPEDFKAKRIRVEYKVPAKYKDILMPYIYRINSNSITIDLCNEQGITYAIIEFSK